MEALECQVRFDVPRQPHIYTPSMTIAEVARPYTASQPEIWARNVAARLGVPVEKRLDEIGVGPKINQTTCIFYRVSAHIMLERLSKGISQFKAVLNARRRPRNGCVFNR
jgi:hypothetical protein